MKSRWVALLSAMALSFSALPAWAQLSPLGPPLGGYPPPNPAPYVSGGSSLDNGYMPPVPPRSFDNPPPPKSWFPPAPYPTDRPIETNRPDPVGGWSFGGGVYILQPYFESNPAFVLGHGTGLTISSQQQVNLSQQANVAPLAWLGYTFDNGWGLRARWFDYSGTGHADATLDGNTYVFTPGGGNNFPLPIAGSFLPTPPPAGSVIDASSRLHVNVIDFESTFQMENDRWTLLAAGGVRYAYMSQWYQLIGVNNTGSTFASATAFHNFSGVGPTLALEGRRKIGDFGFGLYGSARASILFGSSTQNSTYFDNFPTASIGGNSQACLMTIGEFEMGAEWRRNLGGRFSIFTQAGIMGQVWLGGGNASDGLSLSSVNYTSFAVATSQGQSYGTFGFLGGVFRLGVTF